MHNTVRFRFVNPAIALTLGFCLGVAATAQAQVDSTKYQVDDAKERVVTINGRYFDLHSRLKAILIGDFNYGSNHSIGYPNLDSTIARIGRGENPPWKIDWVQGTNQVATKITAANLSKYQVFFANYISGWADSGKSIFPVESQTALQSFVEDSGNGLFFQNSSGDSRYSASGNPWPWYFKVFPPRYTGEAGEGSEASTGKIGIWGEDNMAAKRHPVMQGINWNGSDSVNIIPGMALAAFAFVITNPTVKPAGWQGLLGLNPSTCGVPNTCSNTQSYNYTIEAAKGGPWGYPISWTYPFKKGTIGYFMEGHDMNMMNAMTREVWDRFYRQFMYYLAGYDTIAVGGPISTHLPNHELNMAVDRSGITFHPSEEAGVLITKPGHHSVSLYDVAGHKIREERGNQAPFDYFFDAKTNGIRRGTYILRVAVPGAVRSQRVVLK